MHLSLRSKQWESSEHQGGRSMSVSIFPVIPILMQLGVICRLTAAYCRTSPANAGQHGWSAMGHVVRGVHPVDPDAIINVYTVDRLILYLTSPYLNKYRVQ